MKSKRGSRPLVLFYIVVAYVLLQFSWWTFLLIRTNNHVATLQEEILNVEIGNAQDLPTTSILLERKKKNDDDLYKRWLMIVGEGAVFIVLLSFAIVRTRNGFKRDAELAERQKNFLLSITHELRSPLASIGLQAETLIKRDLPKEKQSQILSHVLEDTARLNALIGNILLAARIDAHAFQILKERKNISEFVAQLCTKAESGIGQQHQFELDIAPNLIASFDSVAAHSIVANLLENAVKYSPSGSVIKVSLALQGTSLNLSIADRGKGIPQEQKQAVFERFFRSGSEETRSSKGTGLGLYIAKYLAEMQSWEIVLTDNPGGGSVFTIQIPIE